MQGLAGAVPVWTAASAATRSDRFVARTAAIAKDNCRHTRNQDLFGTLPPRFLHDCDFSFRNRKRSPLECAIVARDAMKQGNQHGAREAIRMHAGRTGYLSFFSRSRID